MPSACRLRRRTLVLGALVGLSVRPLPAQERAPRSLTSSYSAYERAAIREVEAKLDARVDATPEGKRIESVELVRLEPIEPRDPAPTWLNSAHVETHESVIRRELLLREGDPFQKVLADESARRLRELPPFSLVACVALRGRSERSVRWVVITKDVWSLIPDVSLPVDKSTGARTVALALAENNLFGTHQALALKLGFDRYTRSFGGRYEIPRLLAEFVTLAGALNVVQNAETGKLEGSRGGFKLVRPFRTSRSAWSAFAAVTWDVGLKRVEGETWSAKSAGATAALTRSFGWASKHDFTLAFAGNRNDYAWRSPAPRGTTIPTSYARIGPALEWHAYTSDFLRTHELETLGLQEDFRLGHEVVLRAGPLLEIVPRWADARPHPAAAPATPTRHELVTVYVGAQQTFALGDGLARLSLAAQRDYGKDEVRDSSLTMRFQLTTPRLGFGRFVCAEEALLRRESYLRNQPVLGGSTGLRGYPDGFRRPANSAVGHLEYRTPGLELATEQLGLVGFLDATTLDDGRGRWETLAGAGVGVRLVTPILERAGLRVDVGFPLGERARYAGSGRRAPPVQVAVAFGQAFGVGALAPTAPPNID